QFNFVPTKTTAEMRKITGNNEFNYVLLCNKICGAAHYNMQMDVVVESQEDYDKWLAEQKTFGE
ncbi:MAG: cytochrome c oxidase subunit II, partial [Vicingaceae bacterium]|nr:cytochrome c oxidase subunit II [Vicingaceae bacterium]